MSDPYTYEDRPTVLITIQGERNAEMSTKMILRYAEQRAAALRAAAVIPGKPDLGQLKKIHRELFKDTLPWAGYVRHCGLRSERGHTYVPQKDIPEKAQEVFKALAADKAFKANAPVIATTRRLAHHWQKLHDIAPFRAGNFLAQRVLVENMMRGRGIEFRLTKTQAEQLHVALLAREPVEMEKILYAGLTRGRDYAKDVTAEMNKNRALHAAKGLGRVTTRAQLRAEERRQAKMPAKDRVSEPTRSRIAAEKAAYEAAKAERKNKGQEQQPGNTPKGLQISPEAFTEGREKAAELARQLNPPVPKEQQKIAEGITPGEHLDAARRRALEKHLDITHGLYPPPGPGKEPPTMGRGLAP